MKKYIILIMMVFATISKADQLRVTIEPDRPVSGENFNIKFSIETSESDEPNISFDPGGLNILGRSTSGVSIQTTFIQGRLTTKRELSVIYEAVANRVGTHNLRDIKAEIGGSVLKHPNITFSVGSEPKIGAPIFIKAEVSKQSVFVGEGVDINYYLYSKVPVLAYEIMEFPKLNKLVKRTRNISDNPFTVEYNGEVYSKSLKWSVRAFPEKIGKITIDPIRLRVQFATTSGGSLLGFGLRSTNTKALASNMVEIEAKPLPSINVPTNFTGLVGDHSFKVDIQRTRLVTNEVLEAKIEVEGFGLLESYNGPEIFFSQNLEAFDKKSEIIETPNNNAKKVFNYTYLARLAGDIPAQKFELSYFDPKSENYITKTIDVPEIKIIGGGASPTQLPPSKKDEIKNDGVVTKVTQEELGSGLLAPIFALSSIRTNWIQIYNKVLAVLCLIVILIVIFQMLKVKKSDDLIDDVVNSMKKKGVNYSDLFKVLSLIPDGQNEGATIIEKIKGTNLTKEAKDYFMQSITWCESQNFNDKKAKTNSKPEVEIKHFKELKSILNKNETNKLNSTT